MYKLIFLIFIGFISINSYAIDKPIVTNEYYKPKSEIRIKFLGTNGEISFHNIDLTKIAVLNGKKLKTGETVNYLDSGGPLLRFISLDKEQTLVYKNLKMEYINKKLFINDRQILYGANIYHNGTYESLVKIY